MAKELKKDLTGKVEDLVANKFKKIRSNFSKMLTGVFNDSWKTATAGVSLSQRPSKKVIDNRMKALKNIMLGDIDNLKNKQTQDISRQVAQGYASGKNIGKVKFGIMDSLGSTHSKVNTIVRTNTAYMSSLTKLLAWKDMGFTEYKWQTGVLDSRTRDLHRRYNGKVFKIADALAGKNGASIPGHFIDNNGKVILSESINCRCGISSYR